jgi:putative peptidoglycan lipid II flippase
VLWATARAGMALHFLRLPSLAPEVRQVLRKMVPGILGAGVTQLNLAIDVIIASFLPAGAVSYLYYADRVGQLPLGVIGAAVGTAMLPLLSRQVRSGESLSAHRTMNRATEMALLLCLPAAVGQAAAAMPIVTVLFQRGAFGAVEASATAAALAAYAIGLPAYVLVKIFAPGFFARGDTATPVKVGLFAVALNLALNLIFTRYLAHVGVALATALSAWANALALGWVLWRRGQFVADRRLRRRAPRLLLAALLMGGVLVGLGLLLFPVPGVWRFVALAVLVAAGGAAYFAAAFLLGALDWQELHGLLRRRRKPAKA